MSSIQTFNSTVSDRINKNGDFYTVFIGQDPFTPEAVIVESADFNCGAICNELEFARAVSQYYVKSLDLDMAAGENMDTLVQTFVDFPRRNRAETDETYARRFRALIVQDVNPRRTTRWAIIDSVNYFIGDTSMIQIIEPFDRGYPYFNIRFEGVDSKEDVLTLNSTTDGYLDQQYIGGIGIGGAVSFVGEIIDRVRAAGVDYDVSFVVQSRNLLDSAASIGPVQRHRLSDAIVRIVESLTRYSDAVVASSFPSDPEVYYSFDAEDGTDDSGNGRTATVTDATVVAGISGDAFHFDTSEPQYITTDAAIDASAWDATSVSCWVKLDAPDGGDCFFCWSELSGGYGDRDGFWLAQYGDGLYAEFYPLTTGNFFYPEGVIGTTGWHHVVMTYDHATTVVKLYADGVLVSNEALSENEMRRPNLPVFIGSFDAASNGSGLSVDEVRIYNRVLSAAEALALYAEGGV